MNSVADIFLLVRVMRVLCALKLCDEVGEEEYLANAVTKTLASPTFIGGTRYVLVHLRYLSDIFSLKPS